MNIYIYTYDISQNLKLVGDIRKIDFFLFSFFCTGKMTSKTLKTVVANFKEIYDRVTDAEYTDAYYDLYMFFEHTLNTCFELIEEINSKMSKNRSGSEIIHRGRVTKTKTFSDSDLSFLKENHSFIFEFKQTLMDDMYSEDSQQKGLEYIENLYKDISNTTSNVSILCDIFGVIFREEKCDLEDTNIGRIFKKYLEKPPIVNTVVKSPVYSQAVQSPKPKNGFFGYFSQNTPVVSLRKIPEKIVPTEDQMEAIEEGQKILLTCWLVKNNTVMGGGKTVMTAYMAIEAGIANFLAIGYNSLGRETWDKINDKTPLGYARYNNSRSNDGYITYPGLVGGKSGKLRNGILERIGNAKSDAYYKITPKMQEFIDRGIYVVFDEYSNTKNNTSLAFRATKCIILAIKKKFIETGGKNKSRVLMLSGTTYVNVTEMVDFFELAGINTADKLIDAKNPNSGVDQIVDFCEKADYELTHQVLREHPIYTGEIGKTHLAIANLYSTVINEHYIIVAKPPDIKFALNGENLYLKLSTRRENALMTILERFDELLKDSNGKKNIGNIAKISAMKENQKIEAVVRKILDEAEKNPTMKFVIMASYIPNINIIFKLLTSLNPVMIVGEVKEKVRKARIAAFQETNTKCRVFIGNISMCSTSIDLHDTHGGFPRHMYIFPNYLLLDSQQAQNRIYRYGLMSDARVSIVYAICKIKEESLLRSYSSKGRNLELAMTKQKLKGATYIKDYVDVFEQWTRVPNFIPYESIDDDNFFDDNELADQCECADIVDTTLELFQGLTFNDIWAANEEQIDIWFEELEMPHTDSSSQDRYELSLELHRNRIFQLEDDIATIEDSYYEEYMYKTLEEARLDFGIIDKQGKFIVTSQYI